jgi:hypothetical protein
MTELKPKTRALQLLHSAPGEHDAGNQNLVAAFQRADFFFGEGETQLCPGGISIQTIPKVHAIRLPATFVRLGLALARLTNGDARWSQQP